MSRENVVTFLKVCNKDSNLLENFNCRSLPEIVLHAKTMGYAFTSNDIAAIVGAMETYIITKRMGEEINANSRLWLKMWGKYRFQYVLKELFNTLSEQEIEQVLL